MTKKTNSKQHYTDLELMAWVDREQSIDAGKLTPQDILIAERFIQTRRLLERVAQAALAGAEAANLKGDS
jgi:hypothetical protein